MDFITIGEMVIDFLPGQEEGSYIRNAGGAPANVAISAARNGLQAGMYCKVGNDDSCNAAGAGDDRRRDYNHGVCISEREQ